ncbi:MAG: hypothetical protein FJX72_04005, partial [Armatimonadetes bacterium]|nr:hypothetical protein [Armatimonadota bacterium]
MHSMTGNRCRAALTIAASAASWWMLAACGSSVSSVPATTTGTATITIAWPDRGRLVPLAANSITATFSLGATVLQTKTAARPPAGSSSTITFDALKVGTLTLMATAFPNADGTGTAQAQGATLVTISSGQVTNVGLTMQSTIDHI